MPPNMPRNIGSPPRMVTIDYALTATLKQLGDEYGTRGGGRVQVLAAGWQPLDQGEPTRYLVFDPQDPTGVFWVVEELIEGFEHGSI